MSPAMVVLVCITLIPALIVAAAALADRWRDRPSLEEMASPDFNPRLDRSEAEARSEEGL